MRSPSTTRTAISAFSAMMLVTAVLVLTTGLRVEDLGPVMVYGVALLGVGVLLLAGRGNP